MKLLRSASLLLLASVALAASAQTVDTYGSANVSINSFGNPNTATYGQTFTAENSLLKSYTGSFEYNYGAPFSFQFYVAAWDATAMRMTGPVLYASGSLASPSAGAGMTAFTVNPNLALTTGQKYVAFFSTSAVSERPSGGLVMLGTPSDAYAGGEFVYNNNGNDFGALSQSGWSTWSAPDTAFRAEFGSSSASAVPGPLAAVPFALMALRRRRQA